jgi:hypothetical protein
MLCIIINGIFIYHANAMEVARHCLIVMIVIGVVAMHTLVPRTVSANLTGLEDRSGLE